MKIMCWLVFIALICGCATSKPDNHGIPNLATIKDGMYRGGQPTEDGWKYLRGLGVTNVVKLNEWRDNPYVTPVSDSPASDLGMEVLGDEIDFPTQMFEHNQVFLPAEVAVAVTYLNEHPTGTFVHCAHGQDRTGLIVACYRLSNGWTKQQAEAEMLGHGFHKVLHGLWGYWEELK